MTNHLKQLTDLELHVAAFVLSQRLDETIQCAELISKEFERRRNKTHMIGRVIVDSPQATKREKTESQGWLDCAYLGIRMCDHSVRNVDP